MVLDLPRREKRPRPTQSVRRDAASPSILVCVVIGSAAAEWAMLRSGIPVGAQGTVMTLLMWVPALASIVARLALREGFHDFSFRVGGRSGLKAMVIGWGSPVVIGLTVYSLAWVSGLATIAPPQTDYFARATSLAI